MSTREERFKAAQDARKKALDEKGGFGSFEMPKYEFVDIGQNKCVVVRLLGESVETRKNPTDPLQIKRSLIKADDNTWFTLIWNTEDNDWPMWNLKKTVAKYKWNKELNNKKGGPEYDHDGDPLLIRWLTNNQQTAIKNGFDPKSVVLINCIDRMDDWCKENKHSKLLSWCTTEKDGKVYYENGIHSSLYSSIFDKKCTEIGDHFEYVDLVIRRYDEKTRPDDQTNSSIYWKEEKTAITRWSEKDKKDYYSVIVEGEITDEEKAYERYSLENVPFVSKPTPAGIILKKLGTYIKDVDKAYGSNVYEQLVELKAVEKELWEQEKKDKETSNFMGSSSPTTKQNKEEMSDSPEGDDLPTEPEKEVKEEKPVKKVPKKEVESLKATDITDTMITLWPGLELIKNKPEELALIKKIDVENQEIIWNTDDMATCGDDKCGEEIPNAAKVCIYCGAEY